MVWGLFRKLGWIRPPAAELAQGMPPAPASVQQDQYPYQPSEAQGELRQGEIISDLEYYIISDSTTEPGAKEVFSTVVPFAIVMTPDCDLHQDFNEANPERKKLNGVLLFEVDLETTVKARSGLGRKEWEQVRKNHVEYFHCLDAIPAEGDRANVGIAPLVVIFKRYFTLPASDIYRQCQSEALQAARRTRLSDLWRAELQRRAMAYMQRVALPDETDS